MADPKPDLVEIGTPGLAHYGGRIYEEPLARLSGAQGMAIYEEMATNDATVGAVLYVIEAFLRRVDYKVRPADESEAARKEAEFVKSCMGDMDQPWDDFISDVLSMLVYGFSLHEIVYKYRRGVHQKKAKYRSKFDDGRIGWRVMPMRAQRTVDEWDIDEGTGEILGCWQMAPPRFEKVYLPMDRCVLFRTKTYKNNPEGMSVLRRAYRSWHIKKKLEEIEAIGLARSATGLPKVSLPPEIMAPNATPAQKSVRSQMTKMASLVATDRLQAVVFPSEVSADGLQTGYKFELINSTGQNQTYTDAAIKRYDSRIAMSLASDFLLLGNEKTGSFGLAAEKATHFIRSLEWYLEAICNQLNAVVVRRLMEVNGVPAELWPTIQHSPVAEADLRTMGLYLQQVATSGLLTATPQIEAHLREIAEMPDPTADEVELMQTRLRDAQTASNENKPAVRPENAEAPPPTDPETGTPDIDPEETA